MIACAFAFSPPPPTVMLSGSRGVDTERGVGVGWKEERMQEEARGMAAVLVVESTSSLPTVAIARVAHGAEG